jgi:proline iminopeptidase
MAERMFLEINGNQLYVEDHGPRDGFPMIVHHGAPGLGDHNEPKRAFALPFSDTYRVIIFDARGSGRSEGKPPFTHEQWAADIDALRAHFGFEQIIMAGGSYGGFMSLEYVTRYPDRVKALILRDTAADHTHDAAAKENALKSDRVQVDLEKLNRIFDGTCLSDEDMKECYKEIQPLYNAKWDPAKDAERLNSIIFRHETHNFAFAHNVHHYDVKPLLPSVTAPTLIVVGRHDWITPVPASETIHRLIPNSRLEIFENSGHSPQLEEPEKFQALVRAFLAEVGL